MQRDHTKIDSKQADHDGEVAEQRGGQGELLLSCDSAGPAMRTDVVLLADVVVISMCGELDLATAEQLVAAIDIQDRPPCAGLPVRLDLTQVAFIDSTGLQAVIGAYAALGSRLTIVPSRACARLFELAGVTSRLPMAQ